MGGVGARGGRLARPYVTAQRAVALARASGFARVAVDPARARHHAPSRTSEPFAPRPMDSPRSSREPREDRPARPRRPRRLPIPEPSVGGGDTPRSRAYAPPRSHRAEAALGRILPSARHQPGRSGHLALFATTRSMTTVGRGVLEALGPASRSSRPTSRRAPLLHGDGTGLVTDRRAGRIPSEMCARLVAKLTADARDSRTCASSSRREGSPVVASCAAPVSAAR